jgi:hypothetical protein
MLTLLLASEPWQAQLTSSAIMCNALVHVFELQDLMKLQSPS